MEETNVVKDFVLPVIGSIIRVLFVLWALTYGAELILGIHGPF